MNEHRELLSKWLRILFYVHIAFLAITAINAVSYLDTVTLWVRKALSAVAIWSLFQLKDVNPRYRTTAIAQVIVLICGLFTAPVNTSALSLSRSLSNILVLVGATASWVASFQEYHAHSEIVAERDDKLSRKWNNLFWVELLVGLGISLFTTAATVVLVSAEMDSATVTTIILVVTNIVYVLLDLLYLQYMNRTLKILEKVEDITYGEEN